MVDGVLEPRLRREAAGLLVAPGEPGTAGRHDLEPQPVDPDEVVAHEAEKVHEVIAEQVARLSQRWVVAAVGQVLEMHRLVVAVVEHQQIGVTLGQLE